MSNAPAEVPLTEQLLSIPADYRTVRAIQWADDGRETGHQFIPVGHMMHRAANRILDLERELAAALAALDTARAEEREACAKVCEEESIEWEQGEAGNVAARNCAAAIRSRTQEKP